MTVYDDSFINCRHDSNGDSNSNYGTSWEEEDDKDNEDDGGLGLKEVVMEHTSQAPSELVASVATSGQYYSEPFARKMLKLDAVKNERMVNEFVVHEVFKDIKFTLGDEQEEMATCQNAIDEGYVKIDDARVTGNAFVNEYFQSIAKCVTLCRTRTVNGTRDKFRKQFKNDLGRPQEEIVLPEKLAEVLLKDTYRDYLGDDGEIIKERREDYEVYNKCQSNTTSTSAPDPNSSAPSPPPAPATTPAPAPAPTPAPAPGGSGGGGSGGPGGGYGLPSIFIPKKPNLGGLEQYNVGKFMLFTSLNSKAPNNACTSLADGSQPKLVFANQLHPQGSSAQKSQGYQILYSDNPITKKVKITKMKKDFFQHGVKYGYDTIFWLKDAAGKQVNIILDLDKFEMHTAMQAYEDMVQNYDKYDMVNDHNATTYLFNMLNKDLKNNRWSSVEQPSSMEQLVNWGAILMLPTKKSSHPHAHHVAAADPQKAIHNQKK